MNWVGDWRCSRPTGRFLARACTGELGRGIIACDSWAWAYVRRVWRGRMPVALTLQASDQERLADHFRRLCGPAGDPGLRFRQTDNGQDVLPAAGEDAAAAETSNYLPQLLPLSPSQVMETLFRLDDGGLVVRDDAVWRVTAAGYPAVRQFLQAGDIWSTPSRRLCKKADICVIYREGL